MRFKTKISKTEKGVHLIRGENLVDLIKEKSFVEVLFLLWRGNFPSVEEKELVEAILVSSVENGIEAPTIFSSRVSLASGNSVNASLAAGLLAMGESHGGAAERCANILKSDLSATDIVEENKIVPGFGHKVYKDEDPRARAIFEKVKSLGLPSKYFDLAYEVEKELEEKAGKKIPLNIDGAIAAVMLDLNFDPYFGKAFFALSRLVGMSAHIKEEKEQKNSYYRLEQGDVIEE